MTGYLGTAGNATRAAIVIFTIHQGRLKFIDSRAMLDLKQIGEIGGVLWGKNFLSFGYDGLKCNRLNRQVFKFYLVLARYVA